MRITSGCFKETEWEVTVATIYRCDRCGKETKSRNDIATIELPRATRMRSHHEWNNDLHTKEICENCCNDINDRLEPLPKQG
jgi:ribosomal protein L37E